MVSGIPGRSMALTPSLQPAAKPGKAQAKSQGLLKQALNKQEKNKDTPGQNPVAVANKEKTQINRAHLVQLNHLANQIATTKDKRKLQQLKIKFHRQAAKAGLTQKQARQLLNQAKVPSGQSEATSQPTGTPVSKPTGTSVSNPAATPVGSGSPPVSTAPLPGQTNPKPGSTVSQPSGIPAGSTAPLPAGASSTSGQGLTSRMRQIGTGSGDPYNDFSLGQSFGQAVYNMSTGGGIIPGTNPTRTLANADAAFGNALAVLNQSLGNYNQGWFFTG